MNQKVIEKIRADILSKPNPPKYLLDLLDDSETLNALIWASKEIACTSCAARIECKDPQFSDAERLCMDGAVDNKEFWLKTYRNFYDVPPKSTQSSSSPFPRPLEKICYEATQDESNTD